MVTSLSFPYGTLFLKSRETPKPQNSFGSGTRSPVSTFGVELKAKKQGRHVI